jgi:2-phospho-L-lactate transferase/gluconeogenesis factor (CofD/UPF0052 family)
VQPATLCAEYGDGSYARGEVEVDDAQRRGRRVTRVWLEPEAVLHPAVAEAIRGFEAVIIGPGSFFTSLMPPLLVRGMITEGSGMAGFTAADAARWVAGALGRPVDVLIANSGRPAAGGLGRYADEGKDPLELGELDPRTQLVTGDFWHTENARHDRRRLSFAVWSVLSARLLRQALVPAAEEVG